MALEAAIAWEEKFPLRQEDFSTSFAVTYGQRSRSVALSDLRTAQEIDLMSEHSFGNHYFPHVRIEGKGRGGRVLAVLRTDYYRKGAAIVERHDDEEDATEKPLKLDTSFSVGDGNSLVLKTCQRYATVSTFNPLQFLNFDSTLL